MAAGECVSVSSQPDTEKAGVARELGELTSDSASDRVDFVGTCARRATAAPVADGFDSHTVTMSMRCSIPTRSVALRV